MSSQERGEGFWQWNIKMFDALPVRTCRRKIVRQEPFPLIHRSSWSVSSIHVIYSLRFSGWKCFIYNPNPAPPPHAPCRPLYPSSIKYWSEIFSTSLTELLWWIMNIGNKRGAGGQCDSKWGLREVKPLDQRSSTRGSRTTDRSLHLEDVFF